MNRYTNYFITLPLLIEYYIYYVGKGCLMNLSGITQALETINIRIPSKLEGKWGNYIQINNLLLRIYANDILNNIISVNLNPKSIIKYY